MTERPLPNIKDSLTRPLPKRFYKVAAAAARDGAHAVELDGRLARTPLKRPLAVTSKSIADAIAAEWAAQGDHINPKNMPLTRLVTTSIDAVTGKEAEVAAEIVAYAGSDLVCYRAEAPDGLVAAQANHWDPVLSWIHQDLGARFMATVGMVHVAQPPQATAAVAAAIDGMPALQLAALHVLTTLTGSALIALAQHRNRMSIEAAWAAAHVDEDWQISKWGEDHEAAVRRAARWMDAKAASFVLAHA